MPDNDATTATTPVRKAHADRARLAFEMRLLGGSWSEVAAATGYSNKSNCFNAVKRFMAEVPTWDREQQRSNGAKGCSGCGRRHARMWRRAGRVRWSRPVGSCWLAAARLDGLDAPSEIRVSTPTERELQEWVERMWSYQRPAVVEADVLGLGDPASPYFESPSELE